MKPSTTDWFSKTFDFGNSSKLLHSSTTFYNNNYDLGKCATHACAAYCCTAGFTGAHASGLNMHVFPCFEQVCNEMPDESVAPETGAWRCASQSSEHMFVYAF